MIEYKVKVSDSGCTQEWFLNNKLHREDGPAYSNFYGGAKEWWLNGIQYTESLWEKKLTEMKNASCNGKIVEIDGKKYKLTEVK